MKSLVHSINRNKKTFLATICLINFFALSAQVTQDKLINSYAEFVGSPREIAYVHLNKSTLIKNEMLGFNAYVFDKYTKKPSTVTKNLYCTISDKNDKVLKSKLVKVTDGLSPNIFKIDSLFTSGEYTFRAYTNWMLNFNERNYYEHTLTVIDPDKQKEIIQKNANRTYAVQILPEGGHIVSGVSNNLGVIVKDSDGFGLANASGVILDSKNQTIKEFTLNQFGIAKVSLSPKNTETYRVVISNEDEKITTQINDIENVGFNLALFNFPKKIALMFKTNKESAPLLKGKSYILAIHNGSNVKTTTFQFNGKQTVIKTLNHKDLLSGVNIFTVFDAAQNTPILERLYFNWNGISKTSISNMKLKGTKDSLTVTLKIAEDIDLSKIQNLSVSALPKSTKSYQFNSTMLSQLHLNPYLKGFVENAGYYFQTNTGKAKSDLDNLLITQGWSSYDWSSIFQKQVINHRFESGIDVVAKINNKKDKDFIVYALKDAKPNVIKIGKAESQFTHAGLFPYEEGSYAASTLKKNGATKKAAMYLRFYPSEIPSFSLSSYKVPLKDQSYSISSLSTNAIMANWDIDETELLGEVIVKSEYRRSSRIQAIKDASFGNVHVFDNNDRKNIRTIIQYLSGKGFKIEQTSIGRYSIVDRNPTSPNAAVPIFMINGIVSEDFNFIQYTPMDIVDFIEINKGGMGMGVRGGRTLIKIVTNPTLSFQDANAANKKVSQYPYSLTFSAAKKYYAPIYSSQNSNFFKNYGVISWIPNVKFTDDGTATFKIPRNYTDSMILHIEGIVNGKDIISQTKTINQ
ncbi:MAG: hypothetical protein JXR05_01485 [Flavobacteriaceae bacterium]